MRINPDTKDALLFMTGLMGMVAQGVLAAFGVEPSLPLISAYLVMCGIGAASSILGGPNDDRGDDDGDDSRRTRTKARTRARRGPDDPS